MYGEYAQMKNLCPKTKVLKRNRVGASLRNIVWCTPASMLGLVVV